MLNWNDINKYRENNRLEAKRATGGLPHSIWETYSAFANTNGGVILLGVEEKPDKSLKVTGLDKPEKLVTDFWNNINNPQKVNINLLNDKKVNIIEIDGERIIAIEVPRAERVDKPIYINQNPERGTYRRNNEGDYHCTKEEVSAMYRDNSIKTQDMKVLEKMDFSVFSYESIRGYRNVMKLTSPDHIWVNIEDDDFLYRIGAVAFGEDNKLHPTAGGLLMFGYEYEIMKEYPQYFLDYQEQFDSSNRWDDRFISSSGDWSGNVYDFYRKAYNKIQQHIKVPFKVVDGLRVEDTPVHRAIREALANCLINADYYGRQGLVIKYKPHEITMENPGRFRIDVEIAKEGIITDPRNSLLMKYFNLIDVGERSGKGIYEIYQVWSDMKWNTPIIDEMLDYDRTKLILPLTKVTAKSDDNGIDGAENGVDYRKIGDDNGDDGDDNGDDNIAIILKMLSENPKITQPNLAKKTGISARTISRIISNLRDSGVIRRVGSDRAGYWKIIESRKQ